MCIPAPPPGPGRTEERGILIQSPTGLWALLVLQAACACFFAYDSLIDLLSPHGPQDLPGAQFVEYIATLVLLLGVGLTWHRIRSLMQKSQHIADRLDAASGAFFEVLTRHFDDWGLTPAERDVAVLTIKGMSLAEIADLRGSRPGTVKAQSAAIYKKAGVTGRSQLISLFVEDLIADPLPKGRA